MYVSPQYIQKVPAIRQAVRLTSPFLSAGAADDSSAFTPEVPERRGEGGAVLGPRHQVRACRHAEPGTSAVVGGVREHEAATVFGRAGDQTRVFDAAGPFEHCVIVVGGKEDGFGMNREVQAVIAHGVAEPRGAVSDVGRIFGPEQQVDPAVVDRGGRIERVFGRPSHGAGVWAGKRQRGVGREDGVGVVGLDQQRVGWERRHGRKGSEVGPIWPHGVVVV